MTTVQVQTEIDAHGLLLGVSRMPLNELEAFVRELNALITRRKEADPKYQEKALLHKINQTVLPDKKAERYALLMQKLEPDTMTESEHNEFMNLVTEEEALRNERVKYLIELAQLRNISLLTLMNSLGLINVANG